MLVMLRRKGDVILIGADIEIVICQVSRSKVKVGIRAPRAIPVVARELKLVGEENLAAAGLTPGEISERYLRLLRKRADEVTVPARSRPQKRKEYK
jgi:carbon storage regulator